MRDKYKYRWRLKDFEIGLETLTRGFKLLYSLIS